MSGEKKEWKRFLRDLLVKLGFISEEFTGQLKIDVSKGGVRGVEKTEYIK